VNLIEVFSSVQGEGPQLGTSTLFVRFGACDLRCSWCDTPHSWRPAARCRFQVAAGAEDFEESENPVSLADLVAAVERLDVAAHRWLSLTGGEPLLQPDALDEVTRSLVGRGPGLWLETHGLHVDALERVLPALSVVSMDWKLASDVRRESDPKHGSVADFHEAHEAFLRVARGAPEVHVKLVITNHSRDEEIDEAVRRVARTHPGACLVIQPVTPHGPIRQRPAPDSLLAIARRAERHHPNVRLIPQTHPILSLR
jgi:organic radical activating enzyme